MRNEFMDLIATFSFHDRGMYSPEMAMIRFVSNAHLHQMIVINSRILKAVESISLIRIQKKFTDSDIEVNLFKITAI